VCVLKVSFVFLHFCVSLDYFGFMLLVLLGFGFLSTEPRDLLGKASQK